MLNTGGMFSPEVALFLLKYHFFSARSHYFATLGGIIWILMLAFFLKLGPAIARCLDRGSRYCSTYSKLTESQSAYTLFVRCVAFTATGSVRQFYKSSTATLCRQQND